MRLLGIAETTMVTDHGHEGDAMTRTIGAGEFKAKCLKLLDEVAATGEALVVTKRGKPVARIEPVAAKRKWQCGDNIGQIEIVDPDDNLFSCFDEADFAAMDKSQSDLADLVAGPLSIRPPPARKARKRAT